MEQNFEKNKVYRVSFPIAAKPFQLDPSAISYACEAIVLENMYGKLVTYDLDGQIVADLADAFYWQEDHFVFEFSPQKRTSKDAVVTPKDVEFSFKRLLMLKKNTHGLLGKYLIGDRNLTSVNDSYSGIRVVGDTLEIYPSPFVCHDLILELLAGVDFVVLPARALQQSPPYKILDYSETTGPYFLSSSVERPPHFQLNRFYESEYNSEIREWMIVERNVTESLERIGIDYDVVTTGSIVSDYIGRGEEISLHMTDGISIELIAFTERGLKNLSAQNRAYVAQVIREHTKNLVESNQVATFQFFPKGSAGQVSKETELEYIEILKNGTAPKKDFVLGIPASLFEKFTSKKIPGIHFVSIDLTKISWNQSNTDAFYTVTDTAYQEDLSLLEYSFGARHFGTTTDFQSEWMRKFLASDREGRTSQIQALHSLMLLQVLSVPLYFGPYVIASIPELRLKGQDKLFATTKLWKIELR